MIRRRSLLELATLSLGTSTGARAAGSYAQAPASQALPSAASDASCSFSLVAPARGRLPFALGFAFKPGEIPAGAGVLAQGLRLQASVLNRWQDGSIKFALLAGTAELEAAVPLVVQLGPGTAQPGAAGPGSDVLVRSRLHARVDCGGFGAVEWSGADWNAPFQTWASGPEMASWIYRKPVGDDPFLVAWLELRLWAQGEVEVLPWIENGYLKRPHATSKRALYRFSLDGRERFSREVDLPARCRTVLISGSALAHWKQEDPGVVAMQDGLHLQSTRLVPSYRARVAAGAAVVRALPERYEPLQQGGYSPTMGDGGYQPAIGLLPLWDVLFLTCSDRVRALQALQRNAFSAGRYAIHRRDEATNRPLRFSRHPHLSTDSSSTGELVPPASGTAAAPGGWDLAHHPSIGYLAYLATARSYFLEELQFAATENYLYQVDDLRRFAQGVFLSASGAATTRGAAWANRTLLQAASATPDGDALHAEFVASLEANIRFNHGTYVAQPNNPFGIVAPYAYSYDKPGGPIVHEAAWQQDFYTAAFGYMQAAEPPISRKARARLAEFFAWKARSIIGRLGGTEASEWLYADAAVYLFVVAPDGPADWARGTGPWARDWGALYRATFGHANPGVDPGELRGGYFPNGSSYWGNLLPAICYAVDHGVPGAAAAHARLSGAANWPQLLASFDEIPIWGLRCAGPDAKAGPQ
ncbi:MAG: hypothetical protein KGL43_12335 [Burkholderiales bacterium]|nr:hypothetical protein [Burkholderiales bacterium]MDE2454372.1 hypothetical protein [Burkholderiales bacterium]